MNINMKTIMQHVMQTSVNNVMKPPMTITMEPMFETLIENYDGDWD